MQARAIDETQLSRCGVYLASARLQDRCPLGEFAYHHRFNGIEEHKGHGFVIGIAIAQRNVVVGYLNDITFVDASRDALDIYELAFVATKQVFRVLSFHFINLLSQAIGAESHSLSLSSDDSSDH